MICVFLDTGARYRNAAKAGVQSPTYFIATCTDATYTYERVTVNFDSFVLNILSCNRVI